MEKWDNLGSIPVVGIGKSLAQNKMDINIHRNVFQIIFTKKNYWLIINKYFAHYLFELERGQPLWLFYLTLPNQALGEYDSVNNKWAFDNANFSTMCL